MRYLLSAAAVLSGLLPASPKAETGFKKREPTFGMAFEMGQVMKGYSAEERLDLDGDVQSRTGIFINQAATIGDHVDLNIGVGGLFFYVYPQKAALPHTVRAKFGPGISQATVQYRFGASGDEDRWLRFGYFPIKYNPDAGNLGEYLFRSGTYPGFLTTGGWWNVDYALYYGQGLQLHWAQAGGAIVHDLTLFMETDYYPNNDLTPSYILSLRAGKAFQIGAGASFSRLLAVKPSLERPKHGKTALVSLQDFPGAPAKYDTLPTGEVRLAQRAVAAGPQRGLLDLYRSLEDAGGEIPFDEKLMADKSNVQVLVPRDDPRYLADPTAFEESAVPRYARTIDSSAFTHQGIKLMAMASLDLKHLFGWESALGPEDMRLFAEAAVLGVKDQPYFFEDIRDRIPVMLGMNLPAFGWLDVLSVQAEYYRSPFANSIEEYFDKFLPIWSVADPRSFQPRHDDDWTWSVYARKTFAQSMGLTLQVAQDHLRTIHPNIRPSYTPVLEGEGSWYYMLKFTIQI